MILGGDEFLRTQGGNNNAYCQDNEISWFNWEFTQMNRDILLFWKKAIAFERRYAVLRHKKFFLGKDLDADQVPDITWFGKDLGNPDWNDPEVQTLCYRLDGSEDGSGLSDYFLFFILNSDFTLQFIRRPVLANGKRWHRVIDTSLKSGEDFLDPGEEKVIDPPDHYPVNPRSTVVLLGR